MDTHRLQKLDIDYTVYIKDYKSQTYTLQSLLIDYKNQIICLGHPSEKFIVFTFALQKSVVSAFSIQSLQSALFYYKVCTVRFLRLQKFVVSAFSLQSLQCMLLHFKVVLCCLFITKFVVFLFQTTKACSLRFLRLQKFVVRFSDIQFVVSLTMYRFRQIWLKD